MYLEINFGLILCPVHECTSETVCECVLIWPILGAQPWLISSEQMDVPRSLRFPVDKLLPLLPMGHPNTNELAPAGSCTGTWQPTDNTFAP